MIDKAPCGCTLLGKINAKLNKMSGNFQAKIVCDTKNKVGQNIQKNDLMRIFIFCAKNPQIFGLYRKLSQK